MRQGIRASVAVGALCFAAGMAQAGTIDTIPAWDGTSEVHPWGETGSGSTPTYGQSFTATNALGLTLTDFSFRVRQNNDSVGPISYQAYVFAWTGTAITGPALFTSGVQNVLFGGGFQTVTINTGGTALADGATYVALLSTIGLGGGDGGASWGGNLPASTYTGGKFVYNNSTTLAGLFTPSPVWNSSGDRGDAAFTMNFTATAVPLPPAAWSGLAGLGALGLAGVLRRRRSASLA